MTALRAVPQAPAVDGRAEEAAEMLGLAEDMRRRASRLPTHSTLRGHLLRMVAVYTAASVAESLGANGRSLHLSSAPVLTEGAGSDHAGPDRGNPNEPGGWVE